MIDDLSNPYINIISYFFEFSGIESANTLMKKSMINKKRIAANITHL